MDDGEDPGRRVGRRAVLGGAAGILAATGGCVRRARGILNRDRPRQVSLRIKTTPADADRMAIDVARELAGNLSAVGVDARVVPMAEDALYRDLLINHDFDLYVAPHVRNVDPDLLRPLLHSRFSGEPGWQNPFGFADLTVDDLLVEQRRRSGSRREAVVGTVQRDVARKQPFTTVAIPDDIRGVRTDRYAGWHAFGPGSSVGYLALRRVDPPDGGGTRSPGRLQVAVTDDRVTKNFNPLAVEFRDRGIFTGLVYDPLARRYGGRIVPWLAREWHWKATDDGEGPAVTIRLRDGLEWHDGRSLTAEDVAFTYRFLADTSLDRQERTVPAPRFRGRTSLVETAVARDDRTVRLEFVPSSREVAIRSFTVPVLPRHVWAAKAVEADLTGIDLFEGTTEALIWNNPEPVGSGPLRVDRLIAEEAVFLSRFDDHPFHRTDGSDGADDSDDRRVEDGVAFDELVVRVAPSDAAAVELLAASEVDATAASLGPSAVPRIGRNEELELAIAQSRSFYHVGYNVRRAPLSNPHFRRAVARLVDKAHLVDEAFGGFARPAATPFQGTPWEPVGLRWEDEDPVLPFFGDDGRLDVERARAAFRDAGYQYNGAGQLLGR